MNNKKLVTGSRWMGCYIWYSEEGTAWAGRQPARGDWAGQQPTQAPARCTICNSPPTNGHCTNHRIAV